MSKLRKETHEFVKYLERELREYASGPAYDDQAEAAFSFMDDLADEIVAFLEEAEA